MIQKNISFTQNQMMMSKELNEWITGYKYNGVINIVLLL